MLADTIGRYVPQAPHVTEGAPWPDKEASIPESASRRPSSERPLPSLRGSGEPDASVRADDGMRPTSEGSSADVSQIQWGSDVRTVSDRHKATGTDKRVGVHEQTRLIELSGNPSCTLCGKPRLYSKEAIERGTCASCWKVSQQTGTPRAMRADRVADGQAAPARSRPAEFSRT